MTSQSTQGQLPLFPASVGSSFSNAGATVTLESGRIVNYAMQQNDVPVITQLRVTNERDAALADLQVRVTAEPGFAAPWDAHLAILGPGEARNFGIIDLSLSSDFLARATERVSGALHVDVLCQGQPLLRHSKRLDVLAHDEWAGVQVCPEMLAAFVTPNQPAVEAVLADAAGLLGEWTGDASLAGYQHADPRRVLTTAAAIYTALQHRGIHYIEPPASFEEAGQRIRLADHVLKSRLEGRPKSHSEDPATNQDFTG